MKHSKLSDHKFVKGEFVTPFNSLPMMKELEDERSWSYGRMPEYLWIGLILKHCGRTKGLNNLHKIIVTLHSLAPEVKTLRMSELLDMNPEIQKEFYKFIYSLNLRNALTPLTIYLTASKAPIFVEYFYSSNFTVNDRCKILIETMKEIMNQYSNEAADIRFVVIYFGIYVGGILIPKEHVDILCKYPTLNHDDEAMHLAKSFIRSADTATQVIEITNSDYLENFWRCISEMTECEIYFIEIPSENRDITSYMNSIHEIFSYLSELYISADSLDEKMKVLLGIATYSYKRLKEAYDHQLFNSISGRSCVRVLIEDYIMMKYLVINEESHENIWKEYQLYGIGLYKLVLARHRESSITKDSHFFNEYIEFLVNEYKQEEFINMDTKYFDKHNIREKAKIVNEKDLYGLYYDYDSSFEHGLWGAIRESSLLKCDNPAHKFHCIPDIEDQVNLKSVLDDCIMVMNKTVIFLSEQYGIPEKLLNEVLNFEVKSTVEEN